MKFILTLLIALPLMASSQKNNHGFASVGAEAFLGGNFGTHPGVGATLGTTFGKHIGIGFDVAGYFKDITYGTVHGNLTAWLNGIDKPIAIFVAYDPGAMLYKKSVKVGNIEAVTKGGFAYDVMAGVRFLSPGRNDGALFSIGYSEISFSSPGSKQKASGIKIKLCYAIGK